MEGKYDFQWKNYTIWGGGTEFPTLDEVLTWDSFDLTEETDDVGVEEGGGCQSGKTPASGLHGYMCALVSYMLDDNTPYGFTMFYLHNKERTKSRSSKPVARAPEIETGYAVDKNIVVIPVLMSTGPFRIARYEIRLSANKNSGNAWLDIYTYYEITGGDTEDGRYDQRTLDGSPFLKPVVYYKAF